jgi:3-methylcrotonyl-CoA carboxylase alpha subunit
MSCLHKILIANRGEIACRVAASARRLGIRTVAVYSEADANARHVTACDEAVAIGPAAARESYLVGARIIEAALATGAQAIHPGYGFLSENETFARSCADAGLIFIGPPPAAIAAMGSKSAAKALMERAGVPLVPGYHGDVQSPELLAREAARIGYPVLIKASAGGGGKGMRVVECADEFLAALASCQREALNAFGNQQVLVEKYLTRPRHIEVQVFADTHGACVYLFERDCSVQRRHQKVLEEAPAPGLSAGQRRTMGEAAVAAARAVGYVGAGTVEFIAEYDANAAGQFYFMEMNTRLQVEHPVTEMITGLDLVEWQLLVAAGERLPLTQDALRLHGHAIEARIYAENPEKGFLPSIGTLAHFRLPAHVAFEVAASAGVPLASPATSPAAVRVDSGVRAGDSITPHYDPMIAKLIVWGADRDQALARMRAALAQTQIVGVSTNVAFLGRVVACDAFATADLDTGLIGRYHDTLLPAPVSASPAALMLATACVLHAEQGALTLDTSPWANGDAWRMHLNAVRTLKFVESGLPEMAFSEVVVRAASHAAPGVQWRIGSGDAAMQGMLEVQAARTFDAGLDIDVQHKRAAAATVRVHGTVVAQGEQLHVFHDGLHEVVAIYDALLHATDTDDAGGHSGKLAAPMPGKVVALLVPPGAEVTRGTPLLVMEAMKMEHTISAPSDGRVESFLFAAGDQVAEGAQLMHFAAS